MPQTLHFILTDPWYPTGDAPGEYYPLYSYGIVEDVESSEVMIPGNDKRTAKLTIKDSHRLAWITRYPYLIVGWAFLDGDPVFVGFMTAPTSDSETNEVTLEFVGIEAYMESAFLRLGDTALNPRTYSGTYPTEANPYHRKIPPNGVGLRYLRDAARGSASQEFEYPPLGIRNGFDDTVEYDPDDLFDWQSKLLIKRARGDQVFRAMQDITQLLGGPDMEIQPVWRVPGVYADLNTYARQGDYHASLDRGLPDLQHRGGSLSYYTVAFEGGSGLDNAQVKFGIGGKPITHAHVLSANKKIRVTSVSGRASWYGLWIDWEEAEFNGHKNLLKLKADILVRQYLAPPVEVEITPKPEAVPAYLKHYMVGSFVKATEISSSVSQSAICRITSVTLSTEDASGLVKTSLTAVTAIRDGDGTPEESTDQ